MCYFFLHGITVKTLKHYRYFTEEMSKIVESRATSGDGVFEKQPVTTMKSPSHHTSYINPYTLMLCTTQFLTHVKLEEGNYEQWSIAF